MGLCLGNVSGLKKRKGEGVEGRVRLVDAAWVWTEPHSMRLKVRCDICSCEEIRVMFDVSSSFVLRWYTEGSRMTSRAVQRGTDLPLFAHTSCLCLSSLIVLRFLISCNDTHYNHHNQNTHTSQIRLTIQREVVTGTILQQSFIVTFIVRNQQCVECQAAFRQGSWKSLVQVRQRVGHKRTFLYLEQLILKHGAHRGCLSIETFRDGMDFYFPDKGKANRFISFLEDVVPMKVSL